MTLTDEVYQALRGLGAGDHSTRDVWWALIDWPSIPGTSGAVENALTELWEARRVEMRPHGRWALPAETQTAMQVEG